MTALALRDDQSYWDENQLAVLAQSGISQDVTKPELSAFLHVCQRTGLDPFARQIYLIGRWDRKAGREVYRPQTGIDGYRIVAQRTCERTGQALGYQDTMWCGPDGQWTDAWLSADPPAAAKVTVLRGGQPFSAVARWSEYVPLNGRGEITGLWVKRHAAQLEKCAEALALRKAFPNDMAGVYTAEEMAQADNPAGPPVPSGEARAEPQAPLEGRVVPAGNGHAERPSQPPAPSREEPDEDAQPFAEEVSQCTTLAALQDVNTRAREAHKTSALIRNPATGGTGGLGQYIQWKRRQLEDAEKALRALMDAAVAAGCADDVEARVLQMTGVSIEAATAQQLRDAATALAKAAVPA